MTKRRKVIVHIATSADGYIARHDGDLEWLTSRLDPRGSWRPARPVPHLEQSGHATLYQRTRGDRSARREVQLREHEFHAARHDHREGDRQRGGGRDPSAHPYPLGLKNIHLEASSPCHRASCRTAITG
jgi:hypothetical protein